MTLNPLQFRKASSSLRMTEEIKNVLRRLESISILEI